MKVEIIVPAAGKGKRFGGDTSKQFLPLAGIPIIVRTVSNLIASPLINGGVIVFSEEDIRFAEKMFLQIQGFQEKFKIITGGNKRQDSVYNGLQALPDNTDIVLVHDGVRPFLNNEIIERCVSGAKEFRACIAAVPVTDTIKKVVNGKIIATLDREELWHAQTPQAFKYSVLKKVHEKATQMKHYTSDEASLFEWAGNDVFIVEGHERNIKITTK